MGSILERGFSFLRRAPMDLATRTRRALGRSDTRRWSPLENFDQKWDERTIAIAKMIAPGARVLEFGAGRLVLKQHLPVGCVYTPSDLVDRGPGTLCVDLNSRELPPFGNYEVAVFSGVLEYVNDVPRLIRHLAESVDQILASYCIHERNLTRRRSEGWVNDYSTGEFVGIFEDAGFKPRRQQDWRNQVIYDFVKHSASELATARAPE